MSRNTDGQCGLWYCVTDRRSLRSTKNG